MKLCTDKVMADWLALTQNRVKQLRDEGVLIEKSPGLYDLRASVTRPILYECERCREAFGEYEWKKQDQKGRFRAENPDAEARGFSSEYSHIQFLRMEGCSGKVCAGG